MAHKTVSEIKQSIVSGIKENAIIISHAGGSAQKPVIHNKFAIWRFYAILGRIEKTDFNEKQNNGQLCRRVCMYLSMQMNFVSKTKVVRLPTPMRCRFSNTRYLLVLQNNIQKCRRWCWKTLWDQGNFSGISKLSENFFMNAPWTLTLHRIA